jgi:hypothetical protein
MSNYCHISLAGCWTCSSYCGSVVSVEGLFAWLDVSKLQLFALKLNWDF